MKVSTDFVNKERIEDLRKIVRNSLNSLINNDFVLLDVPNHRNIGDLLIWQGELEYLKELPFKLNYSCNIFTFREDKIRNNDVILLHGGGNFGDVWRLNQDFRNNIIAKFKNNRIIIFPQTVHYSSENFIKQDAELYNSHPDLTICVRDSVSYEFALKYFHNCNVALLPDMAFFLNFDEDQSDLKTKKQLLLKRMDKELGSEEVINTALEKFKENSISFDVKDWPGFVENGTFRRKLQYYTIRLEILISKKMINNSLLQNLVNDDHGLKGKNYKDRLIKKGIRFINEYDSIYSTRLHGFILSVLLNKDVYIFDNSYGKNKNFFDTWLRDFENVKLIEKS